MGLYNSVDQTCMPLPDWARRSGPRRTIYYDPAQVTAAVVTCGGLCPGLNDVIQNIVSGTFCSLSLFILSMPGW